MNENVFELSMYMERLTINETPEDVFHAIAQLLGNYLSDNYDDETREGVATQLTELALELAKISDHEKELELEEESATG